MSDVRFEFGSASRNVHRSILSKSCIEYQGTIVMWFDYSENSKDSGFGLGKETRIIFAFSINEIITYTGKQPTKEGGLEVGIRTVFEFISPCLLFFSQVCYNYISRCCGKHNAEEDVRLLSC